MENNKVHYSFSHDFDDANDNSGPYASSKHAHVNLAFDEDVRWVEVVDEFFCFLGSIYGYPISAKKYYEAKQKE